MYAYGIDDMYTPLLAIPFHSIEARKNLFENAKKKLLNRYLPVFEKVKMISFIRKKTASLSAFFQCIYFQALIDSKTSFVANTEKQSMADVLFIMALSLYIEREETILDSFPAIKVNFSEVCQLLSSYYRNYGMLFFRLQLKILCRTLKN